MRQYTPRRAGRRWLEGAPEYVLDCFDNRGETCDRYTVLLCGSMLFRDNDGAVNVPALSMSGAPEHPQGFSQWSELEAHEASGFRYREKRRRVRWLDLPEHIRRHVVARVSST